MSLFNEMTGMIQVDMNPVTLEGSFDEEGKEIKVQLKQARAGLESEYVNDAPCVTCPVSVGCKVECELFDKYVDPEAYKRRMKRMGA
jgi:hypothetical protein